MPDCLLPRCRAGDYTFTTRSTISRRSPTHHAFGLRYVYLVYYALHLLHAFTHSCPPYVSHVTLLDCTTTLIVHISVGGSYGITRLLRFTRYLIVAVVHGYLISLSPPAVLVPTLPGFDFRYVGIPHHRFRLISVHVATTAVVVADCVTFTLCARYCHACTPTAHHTFVDLHHTLTRIAPTTTHTLPAYHLHTTPSLHTRCVHFLYRTDNVTSFPGYRYVGVVTTLVHVTSYGSVPRAVPYCYVTIYVRTFFGLRLHVLPTFDFLYTFICLILIYGLRIHAVVIVRGPHTSR